jgi:hypothetical protein
MVHLMIYTVWNRQLRHGGDPVRRATITLTAELDEALDTYIQSLDAAPSVTAIMQAALKEYLAQRGFIRSRKRFWLTPAEEGSGDPHASQNHDRILAELLDARPAVDAFLNLKPGDTIPTPDLYVALLKYFARHGGRAPETPLRIRTVDDPGGDPWGSVEHDRHVADMHE